MLHIQTILYRYENLDKVYESIPKHEDITWHISKVKSRKTPESKIWEDKRVILYDINCKDNDFIAKRNTSFNRMKEGWFCLLDDDNTFHNHMYEVYQRYKNTDFKGMIIGQQNGSNNKLRLDANYPSPGYIDSGNVLCHTIALETIKWSRGSFGPRDFTFWDNCFKLFKRQNTIILKEVISNYNTLR